MTSHIPVRSVFDLILTFADDLLDILLILSSKYTEEKTGGTQEGQLPDLWG